MLKLKNIRKSYQTADFTQVALNDISIAFRDNEFAAILGPSGSGKTTLLNIIGGLDQYDSGDLEIEGISTKEFKDHDWDTYRNNRIGFVFQSYNLIPHQTVLANVELALTLSGVSVNERRVRAEEALSKVGLGDHIHKKPSQLSGGQMQRVAIARALINDPEILLADEPTGALDTTTGTQVMDLLGEIAKDRLVIMVTHNSELAETYANRIVHLKDGHLASDTHPFEVKIDQVQTSREIRKASMSFVTAVMLSFSNLMTKKGRTLVTAFAGSIGIIGIAAIIALSNGINAYIDNIQEDILSLYPLTIQTAGFNLGGALGVGRPVRDTVDGLVQENRVLGNRFALRGTNDLASLKIYLEENWSMMEPLVNAIHYSYDITPQIFLNDLTNGPIQVNPDPIFANFGMGRMMGFGGNFGMNVFNELPGSVALFKYQYDVLAGHWPTGYDEAILILPYSGRVSDVIIFAMGLRDRAILEDMLNALMMDTEMMLGPDEELELFPYEMLLTAQWRIVNPFAMFEYDETFNVWVDQSENDSFMTVLVRESTSLRVVGIARPNSTMAALSAGVHYTPELTAHLIEEAGQAQIVLDQIAQPSVNVFTGLTFAEEIENQALVFDFSRLISIDEEALQEAFAIDISAMDVDLSNLDIDFDLSAFQIDPSMLNFDLSSLEQMDFAIDMSAIDIELPPFDTGELTESIAGEFHISAEVLTTIMVGVMQEFFLEAIQAGITNPLMLMSEFEAFLARPDVQERINAQLIELIVVPDFQGPIAEWLHAYIEVITQIYMEQLVEVLQISIQSQTQQLITEVTATMTRQITQAITGQMNEISRVLGGQMENVVAEITEQIEEAMTELTEQFQGIDPEMIANTFQLELDDEEIFQLMSAMMSPAENTYERNLALLGFADPRIPSQISIFPRSFEAMEEVNNILDRYNDRMEAENMPERVVQYTDLVGALMASITEMINITSYGLVAFVSISLVVSSLMIGVITYISVLERKKEIGILRAIGASKGNIRLVFNAETLIVGFVAGVLGVLITLLIASIANMIVFNRFNIERIARLPLLAMIGLVATSMLLTFIAGLIPSSAAAKKDPIEALRSE